MRAFPLLVALSILAGCSEPPEPPAIDTVRAALAPSLEFGPPGVALADCAQSTCFEPTIAADPQGRLFVADGSSASQDGAAATVAVSTDAGTTWTSHPAPPVPGGVPGSQGDVLVQVSPAGRLYYTALLTVHPQDFPLPAHEGIQVAWSDDGAQSWSGNVRLGLAGGAPSVFHPDRQWLGFAPDGTLYLTYNQPATGIWLAKSTDGGESWTGWVRALTLEGRQGGIGQSGPPVVDSQGRLFIAGCMGPNDLEDAMVVSSTDGGATFRTTILDAPCSWFPMLAVASDDSLILALQPRGVQVLVSRDGGQTFQSDGSWGSEQAVAAPWPVALPTGTLALAWLEETSPSSADVHVTIGPLAGARQDGKAGSTSAEGSASVASSPARTDHASLAGLPDGRLAVVWSSSDQAMVAVSIVPA